MHFSSLPGYDYHLRPTLGPANWLHSTRLGLPVPVPSILPSIQRCNSSSIRQVVGIQFSIEHEAIHGLQAGELTACCYNTAPAKRLKVVSDFMNHLFHLSVFRRSVSSRVRFDSTDLRLQGQHQ